VDVPEHLRIRIAVIDHKGREVASSRDLHGLGRDDFSRNHGKDPGEWVDARKKWERDGITAWDFGPLPERIPLATHLFAYPALKAQEGAVSIRLFKSPEAALEAHPKGVRALYRVHLAKDLRYIKRNLSVSKKQAPGAEYFGGGRALENAVYERLVTLLFYRNIRTREAFLSHAETALSKAHETGAALMDRTLKLVGAYDDLRRTLHGIEQSHRMDDRAHNPAVLDLCAVIREDLDVLVPDHFLERYSLDRLGQIPRYLKAMQVRAERGRHDPEKDRRKMSQAEEFIDLTQEIGQSLSTHATREKKEAIQSFRWMVEEYKVSLFAQELKTPFPVSPKRLREKKKEIDRMV
jgi:ATP-dependent helicase HrpA